MCFCDSTQSTAPPGPIQHRCIHAATPILPPSANRGQECAGCAASAQSRTSEGGKYGDDNVVNTIVLTIRSLFQFGNDQSVRGAVLAELKPLLLRVRYPTSRLYEDFLMSLTAHRIENYNVTGGYGMINITATAYRESIAWLRRRAGDARDRIIFAMKNERTRARRNG